MSKVLIQTMAFREKFWKKIPKSVSIASNDDINDIRDRLCKRISACDVGCGCKKDVQTLQEKLLKKLKSHHDCNKFFEKSYQRTEERLGNKKCYPHLQEYILPSPQYISNIV